MTTPRLLLISIIFLVGSPFCSAARDALWAEVEKAETNRLPRTAIQSLDKIIPAAIEEESFPEAVKAIAQKATLEADIGEAPARSRIPYLETALAESPEEMQPILQMLVAQSYYQYFLSNRYRLMRRSQTTDVSNDDFQTWDLRRLLTEIDHHFTRALSHEEFLKSVSIETYAELLEEGSVPDKYRPTLYDFLVNQALDFYRSGEQAATVSEDNFLITADSPILNKARSFISWKPKKAPDGYDPELRTIELYQDLIRFHRRDKDRSAFFDADLSRIEYGRNVAVGEDRDQRYQRALESFIESAANHEIVSLALAKLAQFHYERENAVAAHGIANDGLNRFPQSQGAVACHNLIQQIETKSAQISTEAVWNAPWPDLEVTYRNVSKVYFRAIPIEFEKSLSDGTKDGNLFKAETLLAMQPVLEWEADLPVTEDYQERTESLPAPASLPPGYYCIVASFAPDFSVSSNLISQTPVWVSDLALVIRPERSDSSGKAASVSGFVLDALTGRPIENAQVRILHQSFRYNFNSGFSKQTDEDGKFSLSTHPNQHYYLIHAEHDGHSIASDINYHNPYHRHQQTTPNQRTVFFTDRSIYRPGQTVHYKGICIQYDTTNQDYKTLEGQPVKVIFRDSNGQEIATASHSTNDYGSFSGSFSAPSGGLTGWMTIQTENAPNGSASFSVEEYKRPKFQVELKAPEETPKLGETISIKGTALAYTGAAVGGAKVQWRVERSARAPLWCWWWRPQGSQAIAHGESETNNDGTFEISFNADPDQSISREQEPVFSFSIHADITDTNGETRSATTTTSIGYTALQAELVVDSWQTSIEPIEVSIRTASLDNSPAASEGTLSIHSLQQPQTVQRASLTPQYRQRNLGGTEPIFDPTNPDSWEKDELLSSQEFATDDSGLAETTLNLPAGPYRLELTTTDRFGNEVTARTTLTVVDPEAEHFSTMVPQFIESPSYELSPGETFTALWASGYPSGQAYVEILADGRVLKSYWTDPEKTQEFIDFPITEDMRGGITLITTFVRENRAYIETKRIEVPWTNKQLAIKWERFRSELLPGQEETWTAVISGPDAERSAAEMVAGLYDASLDQYRQHNWIENFDSFFRHEYSQHQSLFVNQEKYLNQVVRNWTIDYRPFEWTYRSLPRWLAPGNQTHDFIQRLPGRTVSYDSGGGREEFQLSPFQVEASDEAAGYWSANSLAGSRLQSVSARGTAMKMELEEDSAPAGPDLTQVSARKNLQETAFFYPHLMTDEEGVVRIQFTIPEALTQWRFFGFAHDQDLRSGLHTDTTVTAKDLMVEPNPPRFLREGDEVEFTVKVSNQSDKVQSGQVQLNFNDAASLSPVDIDLQNSVPTKTFEIPAKESKTLAWRIKVPDGAGVLTYKAVGATATLSDGQEGYLPVLSRQILVTESIPLPLREKGEKEFKFEKLIASRNSDTLSSQSLTVQMVSHPAWYAVLALPYLMEFPHECNEQIFSRYYANLLAAHLANSDPKIRSTFDLWKNTDALDSPLEKNEELKGILIEETPWLRAAKSESQSRRQIGELFDSNRISNESSQALRKLTERQLPDGRWSWFPGGRANDFITLYITTGFGRLRHLGVETDTSAALRSLAALDSWIQERYERVLERNQSPNEYVPNYLDALYLYGRSFFLDDEPIATSARQAIDFYLKQAKQHWTEISNRQSEAHIAIALQRFGDQATPQAILKSLKERSLNSEEFGMYWDDSDRNWWWYRAPVETQALMVEAFDEVAGDEQAVEDLKVWLLKQKQTQHWKTTKATADAVYALLLRGENFLSSDALVEVSLGGEVIEPDSVEAGTGFYKKTFVREEVRPEQGEIVTSKPDDGVSWGSVHWQYLEDTDKVTAHEGTPLTLRKSLFVRKNTKRGPVLEPVTSPLSVGDELVVRIELRSDRDMEYLHLKDQRGSGTEPVNVMSGYRYQDGLGYYESTRDTASHFFIEYLPKGTYVFEYSTRVQLKGSYQSGIAEIQSMYAPEFNSHSQSTLLEVQ